MRRARSLGRAVRTPQYRGTAQAPHLPKISDYLVARLRDKDSKLLLDKGASTDVKDYPPGTALHAVGDEKLELLLVNGASSDLTDRNLCLVLRLRGQTDRQRNA